MLIYFRRFLGLLKIFNRKVLEVDPRWLVDKWLWRRIHFEAQRATPSWYQWRSLGEGTVLICRSLMYGIPMLLLTSRTFSSVRLCLIWVTQELVILSTLVASCSFTKSKLWSSRSGEFVTTVANLWSWQITCRCWFLQYGCRYLWLTQIKKSSIIKSGNIGG